MPVEITNTALKELTDITQPKHFRQITLRILKLANDPRPADSEQLHGHKSYRRLDVGEYRVVYEIVDKNTVRVLVVGKRNDGDVYKKLDRKR